MAGRKLAKEPLKVRKSCYFSNLIIIPCPLDRFTINQHHSNHLANIWKAGLEFYSQSPQHLVFWENEIRQHLDFVAPQRPTTRWNPVDKKQNKKNKSKHKNTECRIICGEKTAGGSREHYAQGAGVEKKQSVDAPIAFVMYCIKNKLNNKQTALHIQDKHKIEVLSCEKVTIIHICLCLSDAAPSFQARKIFLCKK